MQTRKGAEASSAAIKNVLESASAQHASTLQAETAARRQADIDRKWKERAEEEREVGTVQEEDGQRQRREDEEVAEALRRIEETDAIKEQEAAPDEPATGASVAERRGRFAEAGEVFGYGGASVLYEKKGAKIGAVIPPASTASNRWRVTRNCPPRLRLAL